MLNLGRLANVRLGCDGFPGANTLAYSLGATMMKKKVFMMLIPAGTDLGQKVIKLFRDVT
jgi:hypothetical protein